MKEYLASEFKISPTHDSFRIMWFSWIGIGYIQNQQAMLMNNHDIARLIVH